MKNFVYIILFSIAILMSCSHNNRESRHPDIRKLYEESVKLGKLYADSLYLAKDSAEVDRLISSYESALTRLNYKYEPDASLQISEGENDTLTNLALRNVCLRDSLLEAFHLASIAVKVEPEDSLP